MPVVLPYGAFVVDKLTLHYRGIFYIVSMLILSHVIGYIALT